MSRGLARGLRKKSTWAERQLWGRFRNRSFAQFKFRRQHPVGPYILDFYCASKKLAVELDGDVHAAPGRRNRDFVRDAYLEAKGVQVLRFWNMEIQDNLEGVLEVIYVALHRPMPNPHPDPLPCTARERGAKASRLPSSKRIRVSRITVDSTMQKSPLPSGERIKVRGGQVA
jgi:very-short-patch-repair endonuclease